MARVPRAARPRGPARAARRRGPLSRKMLADGYALIGLNQSIHGIGAPAAGVGVSFSSWSCCNTVIILVVRYVPIAAFENGSSSLYRGAGDPQAIRVWRIDGRSHSWEPATGWVFVGQSFCQFHWSWLARLADFFMQAGSFCSGGTLSSCFFGTG